MMKIAFLSIELAMSSLGLRYISSYLKACGHETRMLFLPRAFNDYESPDELRMICAWLRDENIQLAAISVMSNLVSRAQRITAAIHEQLDIPVMWGGVHPSTAPESCIREADIIAVGEGEESVRELVEQLDIGGQYKRLPGLWFRDNGEIVRNPSRTRIADLDRLTFPDYDLNHHAIFHQGEIVALSEEIMSRYLFLSTASHFLIATRGCPYECSFCCNSALRSVADGPYVRRRSVDNVISEISDIRNRFSRVKSFAFWDDSFLSASDDWLSDFCGHYKREIDLPFFCNLQPLVVTRERIQMLVDAGLIGIQMGFQTGSERVNREVFNRRVSPDRFLAATYVLDEFTDRILDRHYHVIVDNPYETESELEQSARYVARFHKPYYLNVCKLMFYPHTALFDRAVDDGNLDPAANPVFEVEYYQHSRNYLNLVMRAAPVTPSAWIVFFINGRKNPVIKALFYLYYYGWFHFRHRFLKRLQIRRNLKFAERNQNTLSPRRITEIKAIRNRIQ